MSLSECMVGVETFCSLLLADLKDKLQLYIDWYRGLAMFSRKWWHNFTPGIV